MVLFDYSFEAYVIYLRRMIVFIILWALIYKTNLSSNADIYHISIKAIWDLIYDNMYAEKEIFGQKVEYFRANTHFTILTLTQELALINSNLSTLRIKTQI